LYFSNSENLVIVVEGLAIIGALSKAPAGDVPDQKGRGGL
jgi:hypothetical protein